MIRQLLLGLAVVLVFVCAPVRGDVVLVFDENGRNVVNNPPGAMTFQNGTDPLDPTSMRRPLIFTLPVAAGTPVAGDLVLTDGGVAMDLIRWTGQSIIFYSDPGDAADNDRADVGITTVRQTNLVTTPEVGLPAPADNGLIYVPTATQPGFLGTGTVYRIVSDGIAVVPEPGPFVLAGVLALVGFAARLRKRGSTV